LERKKQPTSKKVLEELQKELSIKIEKQEENLEIGPEGVPSGVKKPEIFSDKDTWLPKRIP
ncbi:hypothetical protein HYS72_03605, partial [Candidatus Pacearchaeota archaeon]|nr:hypothetical protein [Candidatus Pacearchaeota archaeon]